MREAGQLVAAVRARRVMSGEERVHASGKNGGGIEGAERVHAVTFRAARMSPGSACDAREGRQAGE